jgi:hypothetical protein
MNKCPKCGHEWPNKNQAKGGKARWKGKTKKERSEAASKAAKARWSGSSPAPESNAQDD